MVEGNTLAYALVALEKLVELAVLEDRGEQWPVKRIVEIIGMVTCLMIVSGGDTEDLHFNSN